jgi:hypothetical protein
LSRWAAIPIALVSLLFFAETFNSKVAGGIFALMFLGLIAHGATTIFKKMRAKR